MTKNHEWRMTKEEFSKPSAVVKEMLCCRDLPLGVLDEQEKEGRKLVTSSLSVPLMVRDELARLREVPFVFVVLVEALSRARGFDFEREEEEK